MIEFLKNKLKFTFVYTQNFHWEADGLVHDHCGWLKPHLTPLGAVRAFLLIITHFIHNII